jgi:regulator of protease activity HflC (stomatin/prohibitin superfamily)
MKKTINEKPLIKPLPKTALNRDWTALKLAVLLVLLIMLIICLVYNQWFYAIISALVIIILKLAWSLKKFEEWERGIILRLGKFQRVAGPGLCLLLPLIDRVAQTIDIRVRVTDFSAQETLTCDSLTVTVDALIFWLVWDPEKAALEVADYEDAVVLSAKTALRNAISSHDLSLFLEKGEMIEQEIRDAVDKKTNDWGMTIQHIEITDIQIPRELQDAMSRLAQAEREKQARVMLAEAEIDIAKKLEAAVTVYADNEKAMKLKILSILNEGFKNGNSMTLVPNSIMEALNIVREV